MPNLFSVSSVLPVELKVQGGGAGGEGLDRVVLAALGQPEPVVLAPPSWRPGGTA